MILLRLISLLLGHSYDIHFEYHSVSLLDKQIPIHFTQFDSEYASHLLNYSTPLKQSLRFYKENKFFTYNQGSISSNEFLSETQLKVDHELQSNLRLKILYFEQKDFELQQEHSLVEFSYLFSRWLVSAYIDLKFQKREDNVGASFTYILKPQHQIKTFVGFPLYDWNNRNRESDELTQTPYQYGLIGRYNIEKATYSRFFEYGVRDITKLKWQFSTENWEHQKSSLLLRYYFEEKDVYSYEISHQTNLGENETWNLSRTTLLQQHTTTNHQTTLRYTSLTDQRWNIENGIQIFNRKIKDPAFTSHVNDYTPFVIFHDQTEHKYGFLSYGYDFTMHDTRGRENKDRAENRFALHYKVPFQNAFLRLLFTFDIDNLKNRPWEGGQGQFEMLF